MRSSRRRRSWRISTASTRSSASTSSSASCTWSWTSAKAWRYYSSAGHPPPLLVGADGTFARLEKGGPIIGQGSGLPFEEGRQPLKAGDRIILTTDGVIEHRNEEGEQFGDVRLQRALTRLTGLPIEAMLDGVMENVMSFGKRAPEDDISLLGIEYRG